MHAFLSLPSLRRVVLIAVFVGATFAFGMTAHAQTVVPEGQTLNLANSSYTGVDLLLQGGTVSGSGNYNAYGASLITGVTVSGTAASTINGSSWFNISDPTTFTVADVTSDASTDLNVNISLRPVPGNPDTNYSSSSMIKQGAGTMEMTVHSYIFGVTTLNGGTLKVSGGNGGYGYFSGAVNVNAATTLTIDSDGTGFGYLNGWKPTSVNINGGTVNGGGNHIWGISGGVNMTGGTLQVDSGSFQWNYTNLNTSASADTATIAGPLTLRGDGGYTGLAADVADGAAETDLLISGNITEQFGSLSISKSGSGTLRLSGANSYSGGTTITAGTVEIASAASLPNSGTNGSLSVASGARLTVTDGVANADVDGILGTNNFQAGSEFAFDTTAGDRTYTSAIADPSGASIEIVKEGTGTLSLTGTNTYSGGTTLSAGTLVAGNAAAFSSGGVSVGSGATLDLGGFALANAITNNGGSLLNAASYAGSQSVVGTTSLTGTVGGGLTVNSGGILKGSATTFTGAVVIASGGIHSPGTSPGSQTFTSGLAYDSGSTLTWELVANSASNPGTDYDALAVTGGSLSIDPNAILALDFSSTGSTVNWADSFWNVDQTWTIVDFTSGSTSTGVFTLTGDPSTWLDSGSTSLAAARPSASFGVANQGGNVVLSYVAVPEPSSIALMGLGGLLATAVCRRRRRSAPTIRRPGRRRASSRHRRASP